MEPTPGPFRNVVDAAVTSDIVDDPARSATVEPQTARATARRRRRWGRQAALSGLVLGAIGGFYALARTIRGVDSGTEVDRDVVRGLGRMRNPVSNVLVRAWTELGGARVVTVLAVSALVAARGTPRIAAQIAVGSAGGIAAELGVKRFFRRPRPTILSHLEHVRSTSFPSGHAMASASFYLTLAFVASRHRKLRGRRAGLVAGAELLAASIAVTRVYLGVHWPTDVVAGLALGTAWACANEAAFDFAGAELVERAADAAHSTPPARAAVTQRGRPAVVG